MRSLTRSFVQSFFRSLFFVLVPVITTITIILIIPAVTYASEVVNYGDYVYGDNAYNDCVLTKVVRVGRTSEVQVKNNCVGRIFLSVIDLFHGINVKPETLGTYYKNIELSANSEYVFVHKVEAKGLISSWDFKYHFVFYGLDPVREENPRICQHWANDPDVTEKVCK
ncbi:MAG: hypothetical protein HQK53_04700 [Oligoflexia bacterium]|nr:hypothetical protein [Oligoflexia bacterium]